MADLDEFVNSLQQEADDSAQRIYGKEVFNRWRKGSHMGEPEGTNARGAVTGNCGDTMRIFLRIKDEVVVDSGFHTDGCGSSMVCGSMAAELARNKHTDELTAITGETVLEHLGALPEDDQHCAFLAVNALHEAVGQYFQQGLSKKNKG